MLLTGDTLIELVKFTDPSLGENREKLFATKRRFSEFTEKRRFPEPARTKGGIPRSAKTTPQLLWVSGGFQEAPSI